MRIKFPFVRQEVDSLVIGGGGAGCVLADRHGRRSTPISQRCSPCQRPRFLDVIRQIPVAKAVVDI